MGQAAEQRERAEGVQKCGRLSNPNAHDEHGTPEHIVERVVRVLEVINLDPCSNSKTDPYVPAQRYFTKKDDGLKQVWRGKVYMNPPYSGRQIGLWVDHLMSHLGMGVTEAVALLPVYTDTRWWNELMDSSPVVCLIRGRLTFRGNRDAARFPSGVLYFGSAVERFVEEFSPLGRIVREFS